MPATLLVSMMALLLIAAPSAQAQTSNNVTLQPRGSRDATLSALVLTDASGNAISFTEAFSRTTYAYTANVDATTTAVKVTATVNHPRAYARVIGTVDFLQRNLDRLFHDSSVALTSGSASEAMNLNYGVNFVTVRVQAEEFDLLDYTITVNRARPTQEPQDQQGQPGDHADLIAQMHAWRNELQWFSYKSHTDRWDRALLAFGQSVADTSLTAMTQAEAQHFADQSWGWAWVPVAAALKELESTGQPQQKPVVQPPQQQDPPNQAPTLAAALADVTIINESGTRTVSLSGTFSDADNDPLTITAASDDESVATVSVSSDGSSLTLSAQSRGTATITVTAADGRGGTASESFGVTVKTAPVVLTFHTDLYPRSGGQDERSLVGTFRDADGDALTITARSSNESLATVSVSSDGSSMTVRGVAEGKAAIILTARDPDGNSVSDEVGVNVRPDDTEAEDSDIVARYDANDDGSINLSEYHQAVWDYMDGTISYSELLEVVRAYLPS